ncbi:hypothetical protein BGZ58_003660 [Dissophora ornata]|nr:hypothetical protein BGZ58_003660 [Dissophora ornata]
MAKLSAKREKGRAWTASTFLPDSGLHSIDLSTNLDAITENAMDEDFDDDCAAHTAFDNPSVRLTTSSTDEDSSSNGSSNSSENSSDEHDEHDEDIDDIGHNTRRKENHGDGEEDEEDSSQDQGTSDDSDEDVEMTTADSDIPHERRGRMDHLSKRSRTGLASKKKRGSVGSLSTSPSNPSKTVSATPTKKITKKSKKCVKPKSSKGSLSTAAARQATEEAKLEAAKPIVSRFLELENTKLNDKLLQVFMIHGMIPYVIESITRLDSEIAKSLSNGMDDDASQESKFMTRMVQCRRARDFSDLNLMKKSYTAMNFLTRSDVYNEFILSSSHQAIVRELFKIFRPESNGNFYHFQKVFETILKKFRAQTMATLFEDVDPETGVARTPLIFDMLPFLDQTPVALSMIKVLFPTYTYGFAEKIQEYYRTLQNGHFMEMLLAMVTLTNDPSPSMADVVVSLLDEATRAKEAKVIFSCLADDPMWAERLSQGVQSGPPAKRHGCTEIIYSVLVRSIQVPFQEMFANSIYITDKSFNRVESHLERTATEFGKHLAVHIPDLCHAFIGSKSSGEKFNNAFHVQFYKLFRVVLYSEQITVYEQFFVKTNFINRMIEHYRTTEQPTGSRGYIILILNCIRLSLEVEVQRVTNGINAKAREESQKGLISPTFWTDLTRVNPEWEGFQRSLREATLEQTRDTLCDMDPNLRFQFAPLQSRQPSETPLTKRHIGIPGVSARGNDGIDLGSQYGNSLGFGVPMKYDRAAEEQAKEKLEQDHELQVQKALANLMPEMDWKLIPPQRVINAMLGANEGKASTKPKTGANGHAVIASLTSQEVPKAVENGSSATANDAASTLTTTTSATTKTKKKKKNKKKRQISSVHAEDAGEEDDYSETQTSTCDSGSESHDSGTDSAGEGPEATEDCHSSGDSNGGHMDLSGMTEVERQERKKEKKREKKRKHKINKRNRTSTSAEHVQESNAANDNEAMEL